MDDLPQAAYTWEQGGSRLWEAVQEDAEGNLRVVAAAASARAVSLSAAAPAGVRGVRRGLIRCVVLALDCSAASAERDFRPSRMEAAKAAAVQFTNEYFDLNPISQLSVVSTADRVARKLSDLSSSAKNHVNRVAAVTAGQGMPSLQNALRLAVVALKHVPAYARREVLVLFSSLSTCDPGDIFSTAAEAAALKIRISFVCLAAEVYVCRRVAELTDGTFGVARDNAHLQELVRAHAVPVPDAKTEGDPSAEFLYVGFPRRVKEEYRALAYDGAEAVLASAAYVCPRCQTRVTMLPAQCSVCALQLNSSAHIARSHHHVFPVPPFLAVAVQDEPPGLSCLGCLQWLGTAGGTFRCPNCTNAFCGDCDLFVHESLHNCPGCTS